MILTPIDFSWFRIALWVGVCLGVGHLRCVGTDDLKDLQTVAEKSGFTATCLHRELLEFQDQLAGLAKHVSTIEVGRTVNGRLLQATVVARPAYQPGNRQDPRMVVLLLGNIHSGECAGKEGLLMLLRELAQQPEHRWLKNLVIVCLPNYNADGNDRFGRNELHRPGQIGPSNGMGLRENAQQLDLNRDFVKIESPEARGLVKLINLINPHLFIDCHTTNGSRHRYPLTYDIPHNPTTPEALREFMRNQMMPEVTAELEKKEISTFYYGNFSRDQTRWMTYGHEPRYSTEYVGLRGRLSVLSEAYSYIPYVDRIRASKEFVTACIDFIHGNGGKVRDLLKRIESNANTEKKELSLSSEVRPFAKKFTLKGYEGNTDRPRDVEVDFFG
ncbi:MAG: M14 family metallopeptidase, partial [Planctomycetota bacterium]|nr:M14 family metallopeptidase [Planctomycetota bacterium]